MSSLSPVLGIVASFVMAFAGGFACGAGKEGTTDTSSSETSLPDSELPGSDGQSDAVFDADTASIDGADATTKPPRPDGTTCTTSSDCVEGVERTCDPLYNVCVQCVAGSDCGKDAVCRDWRCEPKPGKSCYYQLDCNPDGFGLRHFSR